MNRRVLLVGRLLAGAVLLGVAALHAALALAQEYQRGPARVIDGDTFVLRDGQRVRVAGLDTPERGHRARCPREQALAVRATERARALLADGFTLLPARSRDKYGRLLASVVLPDGRDFAAVLIDEGLGASYRGRGPRVDWCAPR